MASHLADYLPSSDAHSLACCSLAWQSSSWSTELTFVQLRFDFLDGRMSAGSAHAPLALRRTFMTFFDFDTGRARFGDAQSSVEVPRGRPVPAALVLAASPARPSCSEHAPRSSAPM